MSFILNAVKKQQGQQVDTPTTHHQSVVPSNQNPSFIAWGILLTLAIFAALLAGFYLGQSKNPPIVTQPSTVVTQAVNGQTKTEDLKQVSIHQRLKPVAQSSTTNTQLDSKTSSNVEALFDGAVELTRKTTHNQNEKVAQQVQLQQPKVVGYQPEQAKIDDFSFDKSKLEGVSDELIAKFEQAIKATSDVAEVKQNNVQLAQTSQSNIEDDQQLDINSVQPLTELSASFQQQVPKLIFSQHIYASNGKGLVQVNGEQAEQGKVLANGVKIVKIEPQQVILSYKNQLFSLSALAEWQ